MPTEDLAARPLAALGRCWPEALLAVLAGAVFLGCLGSVELWGKREQRASAEAIDTVDHGHWLVAQIQGRPRLEKPPLSRWSIAALITLTGRRDEWVVRLPGALAGMATVALVFVLGRHMGGRALGLASAFILCSTGFFVGEMRQASSDSLLVMFTTLALYAGYRCLHDETDDAYFEGEPHASAQARRSRAAGVWGTVFCGALGLGCLAKGPVIVLLAGVTIIPYLAFARRLTWGVRQLCGVWRLLLFISLALSWPVAVLLDDPGALRVWTLEMSEKTGFSHILEHRWHAPLLGQWPGMVLPWTLIAAVAVGLPVISVIARSARGRVEAPGLLSLDVRSSGSVWFAWWWAVGNLAVLGSWAVAKPNYYLPCLPGMALLIGSGWLRLARAGREEGRGGLIARGILQAQWVSMFVAAVVAPVVVREWLPAPVWPWSLAIALAVAVSVALSVYAWRRGGDALPLAPVATACVFGVLVAYGILAPVENDRRSHHVLAQKLHELVPPGVHSLKFFNEIDEGLWFYLNGLDLAPIPGTHPRYNMAFDLAHSYLTERLPSETLADLESKRRARDQQALIDWVDHSVPATSFLLIRASLYDRFAADLAGRVVPLFRETGMNRNELMLLKVAERRPSSTTASAAVPARR